MQVLIACRANRSNIKTWLSIIGKHCFLINEIEVNFMTVINLLSFAPACVKGLTQTG